jgi:hypothetical protein
MLDTPRLGVITITNYLGIIYSIDWAQAHGGCPNLRDDQPAIEYLLSCGLKLEQEAIDQSQLIKAVF